MFQVAFLKGTDSKNAAPIPTTSSLLTRDRQDIIDEENVSKGQIDLESQNIEQNERTGLSFRMEEQDGASAVNMDNERRKLIKGIGIGIGVTSLSLFFPDFSSLASISEQLKQYHEQ